MLFYSLSHTIRILGSNIVHGNGSRALRRSRRSMLIGNEEKADVCALCRLAYGCGAVLGNILYSTVAASA